RVEQYRFFLFKLFFVIVKDSQIKYPKQICVNLINALAGAYSFKHAVFVYLFVMFLMDPHVIYTDFDYHVNSDSDFKNTGGNYNEVRNCNFSIKTYSR